MLTLYIAIVFIIVLSLVFRERKGNNTSAYLMICFGLMLLLHTFFNPEFSDNYFYKIGFSEYKSMSFGEVLKYNSPSLKAETGYRVLCKLISYITSDWVVCMFVISAIMISGYFITVKEYSSICWLSILLIMTGPFSQSLFVLRQHLAMGVMLLSFPFILRRQFIPYLLIILIAFSFHQTVAIFFPTYFLYNMRRTKIVYILLTISFVLLYYYFSFILTYAASFAMETASYSETYFEYNSTYGSNNKMALLMVAILLLRILLLKNEFFKEGFNRLCSIIVLVGTIISIVGIGYLGTNRLNMYYTSLAFLYIPNTFSYFRQKGIRFFACVGYFLFTLFFLIKNAQETNLEGFWFFHG